MLWLPWKHAPKVLVGPRHARSSRTASHAGGGLPSLPESGRRCSLAGRSTRGPDLPSVPTPVYSANTVLPANSWGMPWDRQGSVTSCWTLCKRKKIKGSCFKAVKMRVGIFSSLCHFPSRPKFTFSLLLFVFFSLKVGVCFFFLFQALQRFPYPSYQPAGLPEERACREGGHPLRPPWGPGISPVPAS